jgi:hypothetical protein
MNLRHSWELSQGNLKTSSAPSFLSPPKMFKKILYLATSFKNTMYIIWVVMKTQVVVVVVVVVVKTCGG